MAVSCCFFQSPLHLPTKLSSSPSMRGSCVLIQRSSEIKWEKEDKKIYKRITWVKKIGDYMSRSRFMIINSSLKNNSTVKPEQSWKLHTVSPRAFYSFMRPYTFVATVMGIMSSSLMALETLNDISLPFYIGIIQSVVASLCLNGYSSGINQIFDMEIDKVNKPNLPLASGEMSYAMGIAIASAFALLAFGAAYVIGSKPLFWAILLNFAVSSVYSVHLPFLRWKRYATFIFKRSADCPRSLMCGIIVLSIFFVAVALFKDIPDIEGDIKYGINSLASRLGKKKVFWICIYLLQMGYAVAVVFGATAAPLWSKIITVLSHTVLASNLWKRANSFDLRSEDALNSFYMLLWKLIYIEYMLIPLLR